MDYLNLKGDERTFEFRLKDLNDYEEVSIWKTFGYKEEILAPDGQPIKFPVSSGILVGTDGTEREIDEIRTLPSPVFKSIYPNMSLNKKYTRCIIVQNIEFWHRFASSANTKLKELIKNISAINQNPLGLTFKQIYNGNATTPSEYYNIELIQNAGVQQSQVPQQGGVVQPNPTPPVTTQVSPPVVESINPSGEELDKVAAQSLQLSDNELRVYTAVSKIPNKQPLENFINIFKGNGIVDEKRITEIFNVKYDKEKK